MGEAWICDFLSMEPGGLSWHTRTPGRSPECITRATACPSRWSPQPATLMALPQTYLVLSHVMLPLTTWFYIHFANWQRQQPLFLLQGSVLDVLAYVYWTVGVHLMLIFRHPPDKVIQTEGIFLQIKSPLITLQRFILCIMLVLGWNTMPSCPGSFQGSRRTPISAASLWASAQHIAMPAAAAPIQKADDLWDSDSIPIVVDSATTRTLTPCLSDLHDAQPFHTSLSGVGNGTISHRGSVRWTVLNDAGRLVTLRDDNAYFSPDVPYRLLCPHSWQQGQPDAQFSLSPRNRGYTLKWDNGRSFLHVPLDPDTNLPTLHPPGTFQKFSTFLAGFRPFSGLVPDGDNSPTTPSTMALSARFDVGAPSLAFGGGEEHNEHNDTIHFPDTPALPATSPSSDKQHSPSQSAATDDSTNSTHTDGHTNQDLLLSWHIKLGHMPFPRLHWAAQLGILPKRLAKCPAPICPACLYGKQRKRPWRTKRLQTSGLRKASSPGEMVSMDQLVSGLPGLMPQTTGILTNRRLRVATIFVDHFSDIDYVHLQESTSADDTLQAKAAFERHCNERGVKVRHYHADNGVFASRGFRDAVSKAGQKLTFCGVGAHHQNGIAERRIQELTATARASLAHAAHRNPSVTAHLWPYALRHASYVRRMIPRLGQNASPEELFTGAPVRPTTRFLHPFGCPVYVLRNALQGGGSASKWDDRSRVGIYLGHSPQHAPSVSLILNPATGFVSPQFHCVFDDAMETPPRDKHFTDYWARKAGLMPTEMPNQDYQLNQPVRSLIPDFTMEESQVSEGADMTTPAENSLPGGQTLNSHETPEITNDLETSTTTASAGSEGVVPEVRTRSGRIIKRTQRLQESSLLPHLKSFLLASHYTTEVLVHNDVNSLNALGEMFMMAASFADQDTMYLKEAMRQEDRNEFLKAMVKEIEDHTGRGHWRITTREEMQRRQYTHKPIMAVWSFKRKRDPLGRIIKYKARLCCHGGQTVKGVHYNETFAPVVSWSTLRLLLTLTIIHGWRARQIDFVLAFPQAKVKADIYMMIPEKFSVKGGKLMLDESAPHPSHQRAVLKLIQNVYGLADASLTWHEHLKAGLRKFGMRQSNVDPCLFYKKNLLFVVYVDDAICLSPDAASADAIINSLRGQGYVLTDEGDLSAYLGLQVTREDSTTISMSQPAFIERVIAQMGLKDKRMHDTPAEAILLRDQKGEERKNDFHYRSVVGQLNYLAGTTRPDIQFAVHQCARFCENPKMNHEKAVKRIIRYLKRTPNQGLRMTIDQGRGLECFVDADYAGGFNRQEPEDPKDCKSRTGYVIKYAGCPIIWSSKLQSTIALSTTEAEYMALSGAMREVIYLMNLLEELQNEGFPTKTQQPKVKCTVFEDNVGAIELARLPKLRPRTKHIAIQYHHFRSYTTDTEEEKAKVKVVHIPTLKQEADLLTKPLPKAQFEALRQRLMGW